MWKILLILVAVIYSLFPTDLLPDYILGWGWLDDIFVWVVLWQIFVRMKQRFHPYQSGKFAGDHRRNQTDPNEGHAASTPQSPHEVLGISKHATSDEIKQAYRHLVSQYHPDKVSHLGEEFRLLAEKRFKEIQEAYQELTRGE